MGLARYMTLDTVSHQKYHVSRKNRLRSAVEDTRVGSVLASPRVAALGL